MQFHYYFFNGKDEGIRDEFWDKMRDWMEEYPFEFMAVSISALVMLFTGVVLAGITAVILPGATMIAALYCEKGRCF